MSYQALARKWRPKTFTEVVGQQHVVQALTNALAQQRLHHAYLLTGTRGVGKTTLARVLAKSFNCETGITPTACGQCRACIEIDSGRFVDLLEVDAATNTKVEEMRDLLDSAQYMPTSGRFKVYIIDEVHMLSRSAFNSMLKTLEEPPEHVKFILATTDPQKVPITVLSRCLQFNLRQMAPDTVAAQLQRILEAEALEFDLPALQLVARAAQGSMRDALSLLDQAIAYGAGRVSAEQVSAMLGAVDQTYLFALLDRLAAQDGAGLMREAQALAQRSISFSNALQELARILNLIALAQLAPAALEDAAAERITAYAKSFSAEAVQLYYQVVVNGARDIALAPDEYTGFSMTLLRLLAFAPERSGGAAVSAPGVSGTARAAVPGGNAPAVSTALPASRAAAPNASASSAAVAKPVAPAAPPPPATSESPQQVAPAALNGEALRDWPAFVAGLNAGGMAQMLARHCELKQFDGRRLELSVPPEHQHLMDKSYQEKLAAAIQARIGQVRVTFNVGAQSGQSLAAVQDQEQRQRQAQAIAAIESDPFVKELVDRFDAKLIESSIKPLP